MKSQLTEELILPCHVTLKNRLAKSAMSENMAAPDHRPDEKFVRLYETWADGGTGLLITGNVMVDRTALGEANNVVLDGESDLARFREWARAGTQSGAQLWMQLNHPGKQSPKFLSREPVAPSAIRLRPPLDRMFNPPRALTGPEIEKIIERFGYAAKLAKEAGFSGVQIHGAHGYLVSQFLSPLHNQRTDEWGGTLENRMRFPLRVYDAIREQVGPRFPVSIKLNSSDFQNGGFSKEDAMRVIQTLAQRGIDLIEISGGTYEAPAMMLGPRKESTKLREAYFLDFCEDIRRITSVPLMLTGGFRTAGGMQDALKSGACDVIGLARSLAIDPAFSSDLLQGHQVSSPVRPLTSGVKALDKAFPLEIIWYTRQLHRMGKGLAPKPNLSVYTSILGMAWDVGVSGLKRVRG